MGFLTGWKPLIICAVRYVCWTRDQPPLCRIPRSANASTRSATEAVPRFTAVGGGFNYPDL